MATFTGAGVDAAVAERVLEFVNTANTAAAIAGTEPQVGPVHDDPTAGYGDQIKDYDIGLTVAQRIIDKRNSQPQGQFLDLSELSDIAGFGQDKFDDLVYSFGPAFYGEWEHLGETPVDVHVVHAAVLKTGKVLMFAGKSETNNYPLNSAVWNPTDGSFDIQEAGQPGTYTHDLFCCHHSFLADGRLLVNGGDQHPNGHTLKTTYIFNPENDINEWTNQNHDMNQARWYPTTLTLPANDGAITFSGHQQGMTFDVGGVPEVEIYDFQKWEEVDVPDANKALRIYPGMHLMPDGEIFYTGTRWGRSQGKWAPSNDEQTALFDLNTNNGQWWSDVGHHIVRDRTEGMSVILPPDNKRVLVIGGRGDHSNNDVLSTNSVERIDFNDASPAWEEVAPMEFPRRNVNAVLLPTGNVLVCAGIQGYKWGNPGPDAVYEAEEYDPNAGPNGKWTTLGKMSVARQYHSVSLLLPDARILNLGSVVGGTGADNDSIIQDVEVFSPPYLFKGGTRPKIDDVPEVVHHNQEFEIETAQASDIASVVLVRPMACSHHTDSEQRVIQLDPPDVKNSNTIKVKAPGGPHPHYDAIKGHYMLFIVDDRGVPSVGEFVHLH